MYYNSHYVEYHDDGVKLPELQLESEPPAQLPGPSPPDIVNISFLGAWSEVSEHDPNQSAIQV